MKFCSKISQSEDLFGVPLETSKKFNSNHKYQAKKDVKIPKPLGGQHCSINLKAGKKSKNVLVLLKRLLFEVIYTYIYVFVLRFYS